MKHAPCHNKSQSTLRPYVVAPAPEDFLGSSSSIPGPSSSSRAVPVRSRPGSTSTPSVQLVDIQAGPSSVGEIVRSYSSAGVLGFISTCCVMPFEVSKMLMQVQYIPRADVQLLNEESDDEDDDNQDAAIYDVDELSDEEDAAAYFHDLSNNGSSGRKNQNRTQSRYGRGTSSEARTRRTPLRPSLGNPTLSITGPPQDASGYILRRSIFEQATKPEWILPFTVTGGVWDMMKAIGRWKSEGWLSLWKGQLVTFTLETLSSAIQPVFFTVLATIFLRDVPFSTLPLVHIPSPVKPFVVTVCSHVVTGLLLSPLDLIRTRLIVQSSLPRYRKYSGPIDAFRQISAEEGGLKTSYLDTNLAVPAVLDSTFRSIFNVGLPLLLERQLLITMEGNPILYGLAEFTCSTAALLVTLPIETVRRRLQIQSHSRLVNAKGRKSFKACVETRPTPYVGIVETVYRILTEETGRLHLHNEEQKPRRPSMSSRRSSHAGSNSGRSSAGAEGQRRPNFQSRATEGRARPPPATPAGEQREWEEEARAHDAAASASVSTSQQQQGPSVGNLSAENVNPMDLAFANTEPVEVVPAAAAPFLAGVTQLYRGFSLGLGANLIVLVLGLIAGKERLDGAGTTGWAEM